MKTKKQVLEAIELVFTPDICCDVDDCDGNVYSWQPETDAGQKAMDACKAAGITNIDKAMAHCAAIGLEITWETFGYGDADTGL